MSTPQSSKELTVQTRTYTIRWFILTVICLGNACNGIKLFCFGSIANMGAIFYGVSYNAINFFSMTSQITVTVFGLFGCLLIDLFGIKLAIRLGVWLNFIGSFIELLSALNSPQGGFLVTPDTARFPVLVIGQVISSFGQIFLMFVTTKFATCWFDENQRGIANTFALISSLLGDLIGAVLAPKIVYGPDASALVGGINQMSLMFLIFSALSLLPALMSIFIKSSLPKLPPSQSSANFFENSTDVDPEYQISGSMTDKLIQVGRITKNYARLLLIELGNLAKNVQFLVLFVCFGIGFGIFTMLSTLVQQILCVKGYSNEGKR